MYVTYGICRSRIFASRRRRRDSKSTRQLYIFILRARKMLQQKHSSRWENFKTFLTPTGSYACMAWILTVLNGRNADSVLVPWPWCHDKDETNTRYYDFGYIKIHEVRKWESGSGSCSYFGVWSHLPIFTNYVRRNSSWTICILTWKISCSLIVLYLIGNQWTAVGSWQKRHNFNVFSNSSSITGLMTRHKNYDLVYFSVQRASLSKTRDDFMSQIYRCQPVSRPTP
jgi:hypothetical protein